MDTQTLLNKPPKKPNIVPKVTKIGSLAVTSTKARKTSTKLRKIFETNLYQKKTQLSVLDRYKKRLDAINKEKDKKLEKRKKDKSKGILPKIKPFAGTFFTPKSDPLKSIAQLAAFNAASSLARGNVLGTIGPGLTLAAILFGPKLLKMGIASALKAVGIGRGYEDLLRTLAKKKGLTQGEEVALKNFERYRKAGLSGEEAAQRALSRGGGFSVETAKEFRRLERSGAGAEIKASLDETRAARAEERAAARGAEGAAEAGGGLAKGGLRFLGPIIDVALAVWDFQSRKQAGQTTLQAGLGAGAGAAGAAAGFAAGAALGGAIGATFFGVGAVPGAIIGAVVGGVGAWLGGSLAGGLMDMITGADKKTSGASGTFGNKSFADSLDKYERVVNKFSSYAFSAGGGGGNGDGEVVPGEVQQVGQYQTGTASNQQYGDPRPGGRRHAGVDLQMSAGSKQVTFLGGTINYIGNDPGGYYTFVDVMTPTGYIERLAELGTIAPGIRVGARVAPGQVISSGLGPTGVTHLEYRRPGTSGFSGSVNPIEFLKTQGVMTGTNRLNYRTAASQTPSAATPQPAAPSRPPTPTPPPTPTQPRPRNVASYTSYAPSQYQPDEDIFLPIPQQMMQQMVQSSSSGDMMISGPSEQEVLNSFYKRVLLNTAA